MKWLADYRQSFVWPLSDVTPPGRGNDSLALTREERYAWE
jgi:hypothetical protein